MILHIEGQIRGVKTDQDFLFDEYNEAAENKWNLYSSAGLDNNWPPLVSCHHSLKYSVTIGFLLNGSKIQ